MRDQLPRLEKKLAEQQKMLEKTSENILLLTRAFRVFDKPENKVGKTIPCLLEVHFNTIASHIIFQEQWDSNCFLMSNTETLQTRFFQFKLIDNLREIQIRVGSCRVTWKWLGQPGRNVKFFATLTAGVVRKKYYPNQSGFEKKKKKKQGSSFPKPIVNMRVSWVRQTIDRIGMKLLTFWA